SVLRLPRPGAGQVRDVASGSRGGPACQPGSGHLWLLASILLCGPEPVREGGPAWAGAGATGPATGAQALGAGRRLPGAGAFGGTGAKDVAAGGALARAVQALGPPSQHRAVAGATSKKGARDADAAGCGEETAELSRGYEEMRAQVT